MVVTLSSESKQSLTFSSHYREAAIRPSDSAILVHSTMLTTYDKLMFDGCLKSVSRLRNEGYLIHPIGLAPLGEPQDYLDYVMFADMGLTSEFVICARQTGKITCNPDEIYTPQARMYFDGYNLVEDGFITRSLGSMVKDHVPLAKYLICVATADNFTLPKGEAAWTPRFFSNTADKWMKKKVDQ